MSMAERAAQWLFSVPEGLPRAYQRFHAVARASSVMGVIVHLGFLAAFLAVHEYVLAALNVFSVLLYAWIAYALKRPISNLAYYLAGIELYVHAVVATIYLGPDAGFHFYCALAVVGVVFSPMLPRWQKIWASANLTVTFAVLSVWPMILAPLSAQPEEVLLGFHLFNVLGFLTVLAAAMLTFDGAIRRAEAALEAEYEKSERLLHNILPVEVAERLKNAPDVIADGYPDATILFADLVGFTKLSAEIPPDELVKLLNGVFSEFDELVEKHDLEKIKTIGDAYMVVAGLPRRRRDHAAAAARLALDMIAAVERQAAETGFPLKIRIGLNSGSVVAGIIGRRKFAYDLWGDAVNLAARMEANGLPGRIQMTAATGALLRGEFEIEARGTIRVKGKGEVEAYFLNGRTAQAGGAVSGT